LNIEIILYILLDMNIDHPTAYSVFDRFRRNMPIPTGKTELPPNAAFGVQCNKMTSGIVNNNENTMSGVDDNAASKDRRSLGSLGKSGAVALQQEQWKRRPESIRKQSNNNPEQDHMEPRPARRQQGRPQTARDLADRC
jgi:hypothetical protein